VIRLDYVSFAYTLYVSCTILSINQWMHLGKDANASAYKALLKVERAVESNSTSTMHIHKENIKARTRVHMEGQTQAT